MSTSSTPAVASTSTDPIGDLFNNANNAYQPIATQVTQIAQQSCGDNVGSMVQTIMKVLPLAAPLLFLPPQVAVMLFTSCASFKILVPSFGQEFVALSKFVSNGLGVYAVLRALQASFLSTNPIYLVVFGIHLFIAKVFFNFAKDLDDNSKRSNATPTVAVVSEPEQKRKASSSAQIIEAGTAIVNPTANLINNANRHWDPIVSHAADAARKILGEAAGNVVQTAMKIVPCAIVLFFIPQPGAFVIFGIATTFKILIPGFGNEYPLISKLAGNGIGMYALFKAFHSAIFATDPIYLVATVIDLGIAQVAFDFARNVGSTPKEKDKEKVQTAEQIKQAGSAPRVDTSLNSSTAPTPPVTPLPSSRYAKNATSSGKNPTRT